MFYYYRCHEEKERSVLRLRQEVDLVRCPTITARTIMERATTVRSVDAEFRHHQLRLQSPLRSHVQGQANPGHVPDRVEIGQAQRNLIESGKGKLRAGF